ncbi:hypothetical protein PHISP_05188 [Aspergillus sp. HF37]|nr:hypothetical protein PHISP_05188 [Aspergillus sp. HF37]
MATLTLHLEAPQDPNPWRVEQKAFDILNEYLQPASTMPPEASAQRIDSLAPMKRAGPDEGQDKESPESFLSEIWSLFIAVGKQIPHDHPSQDRLVGLVKALCTIPPTEVQIWGKDTRVWVDLPLLHPAMREAWIAPTYNNATPPEPKAAEWLNLNSFAARLLTIDAVSWTTFAIWALRAALEDASSGPKLDCDVAAAAQWIVHGGEVLFGECTPEARGGDESRVLASGRLYQGKSGLFVERWMFWKKRFGEVYMQEGEKGRMAREARDRMEDIERSAPAS